VCQQTSCANFMTKLRRALPWRDYSLKNRTCIWFLQPGIPCR